MVSAEIERKYLYFSTFKKKIELLTLGTINSYESLSQSVYHMSRLIYDLTLALEMIKNYENVS